MLVIAVQEAGAGKKKKEEEEGANVVKQEVHIFRDHSE